MRTPLDIGTEIILYEIGTAHDRVFHITELVGMGASCIVYTAVYSDSEGNTFTVRLKEFFPLDLNISRSDSTLMIPEECKAEFGEMLYCFTSGYQKQLELRRNPEQTNSISNIQGVFTGNNTKYIIMNCNTGTCLTDKQDYSVVDILRIVRAVALQMLHFHDNGYLYLDLKPNNIFLYPETLDIVMLFDFDSVISKNDAVQHIDWLSFTEEWAAPELCRKQADKIDERADVYAVGALLLFLLFKRKPKSSDRRRFADWSAEIENSILAAEPPETKRLITGLLQKTLTSSVDSRFLDCAELLDIIEPYLESFLAPKPYLTTSLPLGNNYFCGRDRELNDIHELLQNENFIVLHGIGGIGKSELAKHYALKYSNEYDAVIFVRYVDSIIATVTNDRSFPVVNLSRGDDESDEDYFKRKIGILQKICTPRHLIILDNFDTDECDDLDELTSLNCKFLVTSRVDFEDIFPQYEVSVFDEFENLQKLFCHYSKCENDEFSDNIIIALDGHTMAVELVSKQISVNEMSPKDMYEKLCENGIYADENKVKNFKDGSIKSKAAYSHIEVLFSIFGLNENEKQILRYISLIGTTPMYVEYFNYICEPDEDEMVSFERLVKSGWIQLASDGEDSIITPHTLIVDVLCRQLKPDCEHCGKMVYNAAAAAYNIDLNDDADSRKADIYWLDHMAHEESFTHICNSYFSNQLVQLQ